eukprot:scaffold33148_cov83-Phaeocystis_antarctica.AAC.1
MHHAHIVHIARHRSPAHRLPERSQLCALLAVLLGERALRLFHAGHRGVEPLELRRRAPALLAAALAGRPQLLAQRSHLARVRGGGGTQLPQSLGHLV